MLQEDRERFETTSRLQRADCSGRMELLRRYSMEMQRQAELIPQLEDPQSRQQWQRQWQDTLRLMERERQQLRLQPPTHYPTTDAKLQELEALLEHQQENTADAALKRDMFNKSTGGIYDLAQQIAYTRGIAEYYRRIGAQSIYLVIMDDLAILEDQYQRRISEINRLAAAVEAALVQARADTKQMLAQLDTVAERMAADEQLTYEQQLSQRFHAFDCREELRKLLAPIFAG